MNPADLLSAAALLALGLPFGALLVMGITGLITRPLTERQTSLMVSSVMSLSLTLTSLLALGFWLTPGPALRLELFHMVALHGYHMDLTLMLDGLGILFLWLTFLLCGLVGAFSSQYLHREAGYRRFFTSFLLFVVGLELVAVSEGLDMLFAGWELVGLSSALLIAFFHERSAPVANGLRVYGIYRVTDVGLLLALVLLHHLTGHVTPNAHGLQHADALLIGALLVFGATGKAASVPWTSWLPRAMEGPTPSSAIFYGALSIHASPFLLLRVWPLLEHQPALRIAIAVIGALTAAHASMVGRTQPDVKGTLGYASVAQVGLIWIEIAAGLNTLAMIHLASHAILRTWQLLRAPSVLSDRQRLRASLGHDLNPRGKHLERLFPAPLRRWLYVMGLERWFLDDWLDAAVAAAKTPLLWIDAADQRWAALLDGERAQTQQPAPQRAQQPRVEHEEVTEP